MATIHLPYNILDRILASVLELVKTLLVDVLNPLAHRLGCLKGIRLEAAGGGLALASHDESICGSPGAGAHNVKNLLAAVYCYCCVTVV